MICSKGNLDECYPVLVMANAARTTGIETSVFFTFYGLDVVSESRVDHLHVNMVGNPTTEGLGLAMRVDADPPTHLPTRFALALTLPSDFPEHLRPAIRKASSTARSRRPSPPCPTSR